MKHDWKKRWKMNLLIWNLIDVKSLNHNILKLHKNLCKAESSLIMQICSECIDLVTFLNKMKVSDFKTLMCQCDQAWETAAHVIVHYFRFAETRHLLKNLSTDQLNLQDLMNTAAEIQWLVRWVMKLKILFQFQLTEQLLYEKSDVRESDTDKLKKKRSNSRVL